MIDVSEYIDQLERIRVSIPEYVEKLCFSHQCYWRIITDVKIGFPHYYEWMEFDDKSWDEKNRRGWNKPDRVFGGVEVRYIWRRHRPIKIVTNA